MDAEATEGGAGGAGDGEGEARKDPKKQGQGGDPKHGKKGEKTNKADRANAKSAAKAKDSQTSWVRKPAEVDSSEAQEGGKPHEKKSRYNPYRVSASDGQVREKRDGWKEGTAAGGGSGGGGGNKREQWKERRGKHQDNTGGGAGRSGVGAAAPEEGSSAGGARVEGPSNSQVLSGGALLSLLKANPPSVTRYTREELLSIGQLPSSKIKPSTLSYIIDKENAASPLLLKPKVDKSSRRRGGEGDEDDYDEEGGADRGDRDRERNDRERRERGVRSDRSGRRGDSEEEEDGDKRRAGRKGAGLDERDRRGGWKDEADTWQGHRSKDGGAAGGYHEGADVGAPHGGAAARTSATHGWDGGRGTNDWQHQAKEEPQWDMPDATASQNLDAFTLGDIRKAEKFMADKGRSMSDYKASLRAAGSGAPRPGQQPETRIGPPQNFGTRDRDDLFKVGSVGGGSLFVDEEDDAVSKTSRGLCKWFGSRGVDSGKDEATFGSEEPRDMPPVDSSAGLAPPPVPPGENPIAASEATVSATGSARRGQLLQSIAQQQQQQSFIAAGGGFGQPGLRSDDDGSTLTSNLAGRSILSMIGRADAADHSETSAAPATGAAASGEDPLKQGKLSVAELFHLAQGKELPPIPGQGLAADEGESAEKKMQREMQQMASQFMWAAAKAQQPPMPPGSRFPGYQPQAPYGAVPPAFGVGRGVAGQSDHFFQEAYAQAMMMGAGRGAFPAGGSAAGGCGVRGGAQAWPSPVGPGYAFGPLGGASQPQYGGYPGASGLDAVGNPQVYGASMPAAGVPGIFGAGSLAGGLEGLGALARAKESGAGPGVAPGHAGVSSAVPSALGAGPPPGAAGMGLDSAAGALAARQGKEDAGEEDAGCSQS